MPNCARSSCATSRMRSTPTPGPAPTSTPSQPSTGSRPSMPRRRRRLLSLVLVAATAASAVGLWRFVLSDPPVAAQRLRFAETVIYDASNSQAIARQEAILDESTGDALVRDLDRAGKTTAESGSVG